MAVRMALFRTAPKEPKGKPAAAQIRTKAPAKAPGRGRFGTPARSRARTKPLPRTIEARPEPAAAPAPRSRLTAAFRPRWKAGARQTPGQAPRQDATPRTAESAAPVERPRTPVLQRHSWGATLARFLVLTVAIVCMVAFAVALAKVTLVPSPSSDALIHTNLKPGDSIRTYLDQPNLRDTVKQIGGNILLGVPFGILLPMLFPKARGLLRVVVLTALVMLLVEAAQGAIVEGRAFDIDDVILNTTGALIGYLLLGLRLGRALHPRRHHWWQRGQRDTAGAGAEQTAGRGVRRGRRPAPRRP
jgi:glycopeptide antibiotics resistance protein